MCAGTSYAIRDPRQVLHGYGLSAAEHTLHRRHQFPIVTVVGVINASCAPLNNMLVLLVGGLPIAMPTILSVTMALGASALAKKKAIVSRLTAVEEIAGY